MLPTAAEVAAKKAKRQRTNQFQPSSEPLVPTARGSGSSSVPSATHHPPGPAPASTSAPSRMPSAAEVPSAAFNRPPQSQPQPQPQPQPQLRPQPTAPAQPFMPQPAQPQPAAPTAAPARSAPAPPVPPNTILVSRRQQGNPVLRSIRNVPWQFAAETASADYVLSDSTCAPLLCLRLALRPALVLGQSATPRSLGHASLPRPFSLGLVLSHSPSRWAPHRCALFLSLRYHLLHPDYIARRLRELTNGFSLRSGIPHAHA